MRPCILPGCLEIGRDVYTRLPKFMACKENRAWPKSSKLNQQLGWESLWLFAVVTICTNTFKTFQNHSNSCNIGLLLRLHTKQLCYTSLCCTAENSWTAACLRQRCAIPVKCHGTAKTKVHRTRYRDMPHPMTFLHDDWAGVVRHDSCSLRTANCSGQFPSLPIPDLKTEVGSRLVKQKSRTSIWRAPHPNPSRNAENGR